MKVNVIFWTGTGNTEVMADLVVKGAQEAGAEVNKIFVTDATEADFADADAVALGCPAMGAEVLEEYEFEPYMQSIEGLCSGKKLLLFGSYNWADGEWMKDWVNRCNDLGANLVLPEGLIMYDAPEEDADVKKCVEAGKALAS